ncbi:hypothetical protein COOONC_02620 [Cooperia oncophora]
MPTNPTHPTSQPNSPPQGYSDTAALGTSSGDGQPSTSRVNMANYVTLLGLLTSVAPRQDRPPPTASAAPPQRSGSPPPSREPRQRYGRLFPGIASTSQKGTHPVMKYQNPRAVKKLHDHRVSMREVPERYSCLPDGTRFLQYSTEDLHIYFAARVIERACSAGLHALVMDGVHNLQPNVTNKTGQLYVIHGVTTNGVDMPLVFAITTKKTYVVYEKILRMVWEAMTPPAREGLRIVLDFERAAIRAAKAVFRRASVEGCAFHLAHAWNRRRERFGLRKFVKGRARISAVRKWWCTLKGLVFLPKHLHPKVPALFRPPVPPGHPAYNSCRDFLEYLRTTWYAGPFKDMWCKWNVSELRTSNVAESFNR